MLSPHVTSCCTSRVAVSDPALHASCRAGAVSKVQPNPDVGPNKFSLNQDAFASKSVYTLTAACFSFLLYKSLSIPVEFPVLQEALLSNFFRFLCFIDCALAFL